jgi:hypothetical protein
MSIKSIGDCTGKSGNRAAHSRFAYAPAAGRVIRIRDIHRAVLHLCGHIQYGRELGLVKTNTGRQCILWIIDMTLGASCAHAPHPTAVNLLRQTLGVDDLAAVGNGDVVQDGGFAGVEVYFYLGHGNGQARADYPWPRQSVHYQRVLARRVE